MCQVCWMGVWGEGSVSRIYELVLPLMIWAIYASTKTIRSDFQRIWQFMDEFWLLIGSLGLYGVLVMSQVSLVWYLGPMIFINKATRKITTHLICILLRLIALIVISMSLLYVNEGWMIDILVPLTPAPGGVNRVPLFLLLLLHLLLFRALWNDAGMTSDHINPARARG